MTLEFSSRFVSEDNSNDSASVVHNSLFPSVIKAVLDVFVETATSVSYGSFFTDN